MGHETINNGKGTDILGEHRGKPNPLNYYTTSWLTKVGYDINNTHRFTLFLEDRREKKLTEEKTLGLSDAERFANDQTPYLRYGIEYRYNGLSWLETVKLFWQSRKSNNVLLSKSLILIIGINWIRLCRLYIYKDRI